MQLTQLRSLRNASVKVLGLSFLLLSVSASAAELKVGGFGDLNYQWKHSKDRSDMKVRKNTFTVFDAAVTLKKEMDGGQVYVKVPFSTHSDTGISDNSFQVFKSKGAAWVGYKYENGFSWQLGQIGKIYGVQASDSANRFFTGKGIVHSNIWPGHLGFFPAYAITDTVTFMAYIANPPGKGALNTDSTQDNYEYGFRLFGKEGDFGWSIGARQWHRKANLTHDRLVDLYFTYKLNEWSFDFNFDWTKNAYTKGVGMAYYLQVLYAFDDNWTAGIRGEQNYNASYTSATTSTTVGTVTTTTTAYTTTYRETEFALGPEYNFTKSFRVRADGIYNISQVTSSGTKINVKAGTLSAVYKF